MYQYQSLEDTIVAISTATGEGGIGIVRLSGPKALNVADKIFKSPDGQSPSQFQTHTVHYGRVFENETIIDEALLTVMRAPRSYTKEDVIEISCHGGMVPLRAVLRLALDSGARMAEPGEFTKRAFLNGRIDLPQAEAVLDIINAKTESYLNVSQNQLKGELSVELEGIREGLMSVYTEIEAIINFPEDDEGAKKDYKQLKDQILSATERVEKILKSSENGRILREGIRIVICGKPNVGKSSLLNKLLKQPRAIVTEVEGTTRDTIEETAQIKGIPFCLVDTAGILEPRDLIEEEAIKRSHMYIKSADLILFVVDADRDLNDQDKKIIDSIQGRNVVVIINKSDLKMTLDEKQLQSFFPDQNILKISVSKNQSISNLEDEIVSRVWQGQVGETQGILVSNLRHVRALESCRDELTRANAELLQQTSLEFVSEQIKSAVNDLDGITGRNIDQDLLETIFSSFCIGK